MSNYPNWMRKRHERTGDPEFMPPAEENDPQSNPLFIATEALNFYAFNAPDVIAADNGRIARETLEAIRKM